MNYSHHNNKINLRYHENILLYDSIVCILLIEFIILYIIGKFVDTVPHMMDVMRVVAIKVIFAILKSV